MPQNDQNQNTVPNIQDKRKPVPGVLPKNAQAWVMLTLTAVIMLTLWISGPAKGAKGAAQKADAQKTETVAGLTPAEISARLEQERREQQSPQQKPLEQSGTRNAVVSGGSQENTVPAEQDPIQQDMRRREYTSRFSSSVSLSYRSPESNETAKVSDYSAQLPIDLSALGIGGAPIAMPTATASGIPDGTHKRSSPNFNEASGKNYVVFEGTVLETALVTRLNGDFSGPVICMLTNNIYSHDGQHLLIPAGTKVLGETKRVDAFGQQRLSVAFHRLIMPDGYSVDLDQFHGLNQIGETGLKDQVNHHYVQIFGAAIAVGAIAGLADTTTTTSSIGLPQTTEDAYRQGVANSLAQSSMHILDKFLNLLPTITIREGHRVKVYLTQDLLVPDYEQHEMPGNL